MDRYRQIQPKMIFAETEIVYAAKTVDLVPKVTQVALDLQAHGLQRVILLPSAKTGREASVPQNIPNWYVSFVWWSRSRAEIGIQQRHACPVPC